MNRLPLIDINYYQATKTLSPYPLNIMLETSAICNISCPMCPRAYSSRKERENGLMTYKPKNNGTIEKTDTFHLIMEKIKPHLLTLHFSGEPLLNKSISQMCGEAKYLYEVPFIKLNTNGIVLDNDDDRENILTCGLDLITFSLECNKEIQEKYRIGSNYETVKENIIKTKEMKDKLISKGLHINTALQIQHLKGDGVIDSMLMESKEMWEKLGIFVKFASICTIGEQVENFGSVREPKANCREIWTNMIISWDGKVTPCCVDHAFQLSFGNILETKIEDLWNNVQIKALREKHTWFNKTGEKGELPQLCQQCLGSK